MQPAWWDIGLFGLIQLFMLVGLFGLIVPIFPGTVVMWIATLIYGILDSAFTPLGIALFAAITLLMIASTVVDNLMMGVGARQGGAGWISILTAMAAGLLGTFLLPPVGGIIAAPLALLGMEYRRWRNWQRAWEALKGLATGWGLSFIIRFAMGMLMMVLWWLWVWKGS